MNNPDALATPERNTSRPNTLKTRIGEAAFKWWSGHSREEAESWKFWGSINDLLKIDGVLVNNEWRKNRQAELLKLADDSSNGDPYIRAYGRAHLEDYVRHQGSLADGRVVARIPAYGVDKEILSELGIAADTFDHGRIAADSDANLTIILPNNWSFKVADTPLEDGAMPSPLLNERFAALYNEEDEPVATVFYNHKPLGFGDGFRSYTHIHHSSL